MTWAETVSKTNVDCSYEHNPILLLYSLNMDSFLLSRVSYIFTNRADLAYFKCKEHSTCTLRATIFTHLQCDWEYTDSTKELLLLVS